jgi:serine/threonine-protein kinase
MAIDSTLELLDQLTRWKVLDAGQRDALAGDARFVGLPLRGAAQELIRRQALSPFQINQVLQGKGGQLLLGSYVLQEKLGEGGMGAVFKARNWKLDKVVALKLIRAERLANQSAVTRFEREIRAAARLDHPNIVRALDADNVGGTHLLVMEYVAGGIDLNRLVKEQGPLTVDQACRFIREAALGLQHAHERGLVHRDIKPHNLLVSGIRSQESGVRSQESAAKKPSSSLTPDPCPLTPVVRILDFGLARLGRGEHGESSSTLTQEGSVMGTLDYIAPEQATDSHNVDIRADLYSLGCTFYYLLSGRVLFPGGEALAKLMKHRFDEPTPIETLRPGLPHAVAAVVRKLTAKRPEDRFQTPAELIAVLDQVLAGNTKALAALAPPPAPTSAPTTSSAAENPFARLEASDTEAMVAAPRSNSGIRRGQPSRRWLLAAAGGGLVVAVAAIAVAAKLMSGTPPREPQVAVAPKPPRQPSSLEKAALQEDPAKQVEKQRLALVKQQRAQHEARWQERVRAADAALPALQPKLEAAGAKLAAVAGDVVAFKSKHGGTPAAIRAAELLTKLPSPLDQLGPQAIPADAKEAWQAQSSGGKDVVAVLGVHSRRHWGQVGGVVISPDSRIVATSSADLTVALWDAATGKLLHRIVGFFSEGRPMAFSRDGTLLAVGGKHGIVKLWDTSTWREVLSFPAFPEVAKVAGYAQIFSLAFRADKRVLATTGYQGGELAKKENFIKLWDVATGKLLHTLAGHSNWVMWLDFAPQGTRLASASRDGTVRIWDTQPPGELRVLAGPPGSIDHVAFSPDGSQVACVSNSSHARAWLTATGKELYTRIANGVAFPQDRGAVTIAHFKTERLDMKDAATDKLLQTFPFDKFPGAACFALTPDGRMLVTGHLEGAVRFWDVQTGKETSPLAPPVGAAQHLHFTPDAQRLIVTYADGSARLWNCATLKSELQVDGIAKEGRLAVSPSGQGMVVPAAEESALRIINFDQGKEVKRLKVPPAALWGFTPNNARIVLGGGNTLHLVRVLPSEQITDFRVPHPQGMTGVAITPDSEHALSCSWGSGTLYLTDLKTGDQVREYFPDSRGDGQGVAISPDGRRAAAWLRAGGVKLFDLIDGDDSAITVLEGTLLRDGKPISLTFSADGKLFATVAANEQVVVFDAPTGQKRFAWQLPGPVHALAFAPDGRHLATANGNGTVYILRFMTSFSPVSKKRGGSIAG